MSSLNRQRALALDVLDHQVGHDRRLTPIDPRAAPVVDAVRDMMQRDHPIVGVWAREGPQAPLVERSVRERDQVLVPAPVVPEQRVLRQPGVEAGVQDALGRLLVGIVAVGVKGRRLEEAGRR